MATSLIIFDCDGVLIDSEVISADVIISELALIGIEVDRAHVRRHFLGRSFPTVAAGIRRDFAVALPDDFEARYRASLLERFETELVPMPGIFEVLARLRVPSCVATSSSPPRVARSLALAGLAPHFAHVFTASMVARGKPAPDLFLHAAASMGAAPEEVLVIEDSLPGIEAARAAGMRPLAFLGGSHHGGGTFDITPPVLSLSGWSGIFSLMPDLFTPEASL